VIAVKQVRERGPRNRMLADSPVARASSRRRQVRGEPLGFKSEKPNIRLISHRRCCIGPDKTSGRE
jgi:hypothetical protein